MENGFSNIKGMFRANTDIINKAIGDIRDEDWFRQPGDESNHLLWLLGHVVVHRGEVLKTLGVDWNSSWEGLFARGAERIDHAEYPSIADIRAAWTDVSEKLRGALREPAEEVLAKPAPEGPPSFDKKLSGTVAFYALHDTYHAGQLCYLRKWLGYGQTIG